MSSNFDLESLVNLEQTFYDDGYKDGYAHGRIHGLIEGRALGREKGFEMWEELGFYEGFALMWKAIYSKQGRQDDRGFHHILQLLELISQFPKTNPSAEASDVDIPKLFRQIRSRYKILCASLGVKASLRASDVPSSSPPEDDGNEVPQGVTATRKVWEVKKPGETNTTQDLSF
ncbi:DUF1715-domain-containing protein [Gloeophyllum trabeum ATCC 11539]|uniref:DUF1715-domain-containing protein n=1 Tax=Gloeophyllum trabeum (strain ATCC 11539 / FP-39264 / Madison 617) TaxID=670483 RepID=S7RFW1_GLOTA|nr:DUF1715-domain-containing protein [Gloeophyllum trabeum ATCC 11539]EPQ53080.1 DUF1715-domain-containing protein [Gloeophyllum trabeum ATCC 11539]